MTEDDVEFSMGRDASNAESEIDDSDDIRDGTV